MHSASVTVLRRCLEWNNVGKSRNPLPSNELRMFTDVSERINPFLTQNTTFY